MPSRRVGIFMVGYIRQIEPFTTLVNTNELSLVSDNGMVGLIL